ncbi:Uncharacterised protein [Bordetella trematum]|uniref:hypothetical protein n=1 Tax=Bordetella trematum TaxID=123899 RepID=UPI0007962042|nr:hypothetical protein [Bordetella trematum]SAI40979.1 Uncharacterised protein [Bordetella trematum]
MFTRNAIALGFLALSAACPAHADAFLILTDSADPILRSNHPLALPSCEQLALGYLASIYAHRLESPGLVTLAVDVFESPAIPADPAILTQGQGYGLPAMIEQHCRPPAKQSGDRLTPPQDGAYGMAWLRQAGASVLARGKLPGVIEQLAHRAAFGQDNTQDTPHVRAGRYPRRSTRRVGPATV